jgi:hypothetical protein
VEPVEPQSTPQKFKLMVTEKLMHLFPIAVHSVCTVDDEKHMLVYETKSGPVRLTSTFEARLAAPQSVEVIETSVIECAAVLRWYVRRTVVNAHGRMMDKLQSQFSAPQSSTSTSTST